MTESISFRICMSSPFFVVNVDVNKNSGFFSNRKEQCFFLV